jgi:hypothetical protein
MLAPALKRAGMLQGIPPGTKTPTLTHNNYEMRHGFVLFRLRQSQLHPSAVRTA